MNSVRPKTFMVIQGMVPEPIPRRMAPQPATTPAAGVMATRPVIMPWMAPMTEGRLKNIMSMVTQVSRLMAVQMLVFKTATPASGLAEYGSPPLKPFQPVQRIPAPTSMRVMLLGLASMRSMSSLGPIHHAPTKPAVPDDK